MATEPRLLGTDVSIRIVQDGQPVQAVNAVASFNDTVSLEMKEDGFLGEPTNRFDNVHKGYKGDLEFQVNRVTWETVFLKAVEQRARREVFSVFNVLRTDRYSNGQIAVSTYKEVAFGEFQRTTASRADFVKVKTSFGCSERTTQVV